MVVVTIVVTIYTAGVGTTGISTVTNTFGEIMKAGIASMGNSVGLAAASAFVGSAAGQAIGSGLGVASFSWRSAASSGLAAGLTAGLGKLELLSKVAGKLGAFGETAFGQGVVSGISSNLVRQATDRIAGVDTSFSWKSVAISAVSAGIGSTVAGAVESRLNLETETGQMVKDFVGGAAGGLVSHHLRRQVGLDKGANYGLVVADAFGTMLANRMTGQYRMAAADAAAQAASEDQATQAFATLQEVRAHEAEVFALGPDASPASAAALPVGAQPAAASFNRRHAISSLNKLFDSPLANDISNDELQAMLRTYASELSGTSTHAPTLATVHVVGRRETGANGPFPMLALGRPFSGEWGGGGAPRPAPSNWGLGPRSTAAAIAYNAVASRLNNEGEKVWNAFDASSLGQALEGTRLRAYMEEQRFRFPLYDGQDPVEVVVGGLLPTAQEMAERGQPGTYFDNAAGYYKGLANAGIGLWNGTIGSSTLAGISDAFFDASWQFEPIQLSDTQLSGAAHAEFHTAALGVVAGARFARNGGLETTKRMTASSGATGLDRLVPPGAFSEPPTLPATSVNAADALSRKLSALEKAQIGAARTIEVGDGRVLYYGREIPARTLGQTRGASLVTEYDMTTGRLRQYYESYDHQGTPIRVHPKMIDGFPVNSQHYPPTGTELAR